MVETLDVSPLGGLDPELGLLVAAMDDAANEARLELGELKEDELVRRPFENGPSIGSLLLHVAQAESWWTQAVVAGIDPRKRFAHLSVLAIEIDANAGRWGKAPVMPLADYYRVLDEVRQGTREALIGQRAEAAKQPSRDSEERMTVRWIVNHLVQHEAYHGGQAVIIKRMLRGGSW